MHQRDELQRHMNSCIAKFDFIPETHNVMSTPETFNVMNTPGTRNIMNTSETCNAKYATYEQLCCEHTEDKHC